MRRMVLSVAAALCGSGLVVACSGGGGCGGGGCLDAAEGATPLPAMMRGGTMREIPPPPPDAAPAADAVADAAPAAPPDAAPAALTPDGSPFGASCGQEDECDSNVCADHQCSIGCDVDDPHACREALGLCAPARHGRHACQGGVASGPDGDDALLHPGDTASASFATPGDVDVFRLAAPPGAWRVVATPAADVDLALDFYDAHATLLGTSDDGVASAPESASFTAADDTGAFAVVRHAGGAPGAYVVRLEAVQP